eukprot:TRINITY_DN24131_c0_g1_i1.p1 TRINITY_DN24131_c0_g1~~TRINITY_DN24131_c0_g1_i1.p1  ORF type:complete len:628 (-),score=102.49 TRINITY_DN24131_c0_g1_i1:112-1755(-)
MSAGGSSLQTPRGTEISHLSAFSGSRSLTRSLSRTPSSWPRVLGVSGGDATCSGYDRGGSGVAASLLAATGELSSARRGRRSNRGSLHNVSPGSFGISGVFAGGALGSGVRRSSRPASSRSKDGSILEEAFDVQSLAASSCQASTLAGSGSSTLSNLSLSEEEGDGCRHARPSLASRASAVCGSRSVSGCGSGTVLTTDAAYSPSGASRFAGTTTNSASAASSAASATAASAQQPIPPSPVSAMNCRTPRPSRAAAASVAVVSGAPLAARAGRGSASTAAAAGSSRTAVATTGPVCSSTASAGSSGGSSVGIGGSSSSGSGGGFGGRRPPDKDLVASVPSGEMPATSDSAEAAARREPGTTPTSARRRRTRASGGSLALASLDNVGTSPGGSTSVASSTAVASPVRRRSASAVPPVNLVPSFSQGAVLGSVESIDSLDVEIMRSSRGLQTPSSRNAMRPTESPLHRPAESPEPRRPLVQQPSSGTFAGNSRVGTPTRGGTRTSTPTSSSAGGFFGGGEALTPSARSTANGQRSSLLKGTGRSICTPT